MSRPMLDGISIWVPVSQRRFQSAVCWHFILRILGVDDDAKHHSKVASLVASVVIVFRPRRFGQATLDTVRCGSSAGRGAA